MVSRRQTTSSRRHQLTDYRYFHLTSSAVVSLFRPKVGTEVLQPGVAGDRGDDHSRRTSGRDL